MPGDGGAARGGKREVVLRAARELFLEHGFASTSVDAVTRRAGVSKPTVYAHFPHKDALLEAVVREESSRIVAALEFPATGDAAADLHAIGLGIVRLAAAPEVANWNRLIGAEANRSPELGRLLFDGGPGRILVRLAARLRELASAGSLAVDDADEAAEFFFGLILGVPSLRSLLCGDRPEHRPSDARVGRAVDAFLRAYAPPGDGPGALPTRGRAPKR